MKLEFKIIMGGEESLKKKFEESLKANPGLQMDLIRAFAHTVMISLRLNESDNISVLGFRAGEIPDTNPVTQEEKDKWSKEISNQFENKKVE